MKHKNLYIIFILLIVHNSFGQQSIAELLKKLNSGSIPYITFEELSEEKNNVILLDAREWREYAVSHLKDARYVGYETFNLKNTVKQINDKNTKIVVYCSIGVRSEDIAEKLDSIGYKNIYNLYGGIFEWKNNNLTVHDRNNNPTNKVHVFSTYWGKWLEKGQKVYD